jgi:hypothetical protein
MRTRGGDPAAAAQLLQLGREFEPDTVAELFEELAAAHQAAGAINLAADARMTLLQTRPQAAAARRAALWLVQLYGSSEVAHWQNATRTDNDAETDRGLANFAFAMAGEYETAARRGANASNAATETEPDAAAAGDGGVVPAAATAPAAASDAELRFARAVAGRRAGLTKQATALLTPLKHRPQGDPWGDCARLEEWLGSKKSDAPPKPRVRCIATADRPVLDGRFDDACWVVAEQVFLNDPPGNSQGDTDASLLITYDAEFLYLAIVCPRAKGVDYSHADQPRPRDGDLSARDRVTLALDADRDYATGWELTVDSRGWTGDRCWGDAAWNPQWFVAARAIGDDDDAQQSGRNLAWAAEAAIPWSALARRAPRAGEAWALSIQRSIPGAAGEVWPSGAKGEPATTGPAAFGVLAFE